MSNIKKIQSISEKCFKDIVAIRRHLHKYPELSFHEKRTAEFIASKLEELKIPFRQGIAGNGILAAIEGKLKSSSKKKITVALRADMDALPVQEENKKEYASKNKGVMHACGHDTHMASLLGTARILKEMEKEFYGTVLFIFQPAEEKIPGGAKAMLGEGLFSKIKPDVVLAQHVEPALDEGTVGFKPGIYMASTDEIYLTVKGKGGHGAMPHMNIDTVLIAAHIIVALQQIVSRHANPLIPSVLSFGKIIGNGAVNIIPDVVKIDGTFRTTNEKWRSEAHKKMRKMAEYIAEAMGGKCETEIFKGYPALVNDESVTLRAHRLAGEYLGKNKVLNLEQKMTSEDFSYFAQLYPSTFYRLGIRNEKKKITSSLHTSTFDINEESLKTGMGLMAWLAVSFLSEK